jgi:hypothetical protein
LSHVTRYQPDGDKIMRLQTQMAMIENDFVHLPEKAHWPASRSADADGSGFPAHSKLSGRHLHPAPRTGQ